MDFLRYLLSGNTETHKLVVRKLTEKETKEFKDLYKDVSELQKEKKRLDAKLQIVCGKRDLLWSNLGDGIDEGKYEVDIDTGFLYRHEEIENDM